jgi:hypothetical protein
VKEQQVPAETDVNIPSLTGQAREWNAQSTAMGSAASEAASSMPSGAANWLGQQGSTQTSAGVAGDDPGLAAIGMLMGDYGFFGPIIEAYESVCPQMAKLAAEGQQQMSAIADALGSAVLAYQANESDIARASGDALH